MKRLADFIVNKRIFLLAAVLAAAAVCAVLSFGVETNRDMTKYLSDSSEMKQGLDIMDSEFPGSGDAASIRVVFDGISPAQADEIKLELEAAEYVESVDYEAGSTDYIRDGHTLFVVNTAYGYGSDEEAAIERYLDGSFGEYCMSFQNNDVQSSEVTPLLLISALAIALIILVIMSRSWLEPVLFMATIGLAVLINLGTNIVFPYVSDLTASVAPIIQLALSMDYSIILMNRYRQEKERCPDRSGAMKAALAGALPSIASSAFTTAVGLLALVFLSFKAGPELGIVLAKGVFISMLCVFFVLPTLILRFDRGIEKSAKRSPHIPTGALARFSRRARYIMPALFAVMFVAFCFIQKSTGVTFTEGIDDPLAELFPKENTLVLVYDNSDEEGAAALISELENDGHIKNLTGYSNTLGAERGAADMAETLSAAGGVSVDEATVCMVYFLRFGGEMPEMTVRQFVSFLKDEVLTNAAFSEMLGESAADKIGMLEKFTDEKALASEMTAAETASFFGIDSGTVESLFLYYFSVNGGTGAQTMTPTRFLDFVIDGVLPNPAFSGSFDDGTALQLKALRALTGAASAGGSYSPSEMHSLLGAAAGDMTEADMELLYTFYGAVTTQSPDWKMTLPQMLEYLRSELSGDERFSSLFDAETKSSLELAEAGLDEASAQMKGQSYSRLVITTDYPEESAETDAFVSRLNELRGAALGSPSYLVGASAMVHEMKQGFGNEFLMISLITAAAIFLVVLLTFRNFVVSALLTLLVQCGVFITVSAAGLRGGTIYYLALLIVQSILMGATIDYGIVFSSNYRESRMALDRAAAVGAAYQSSIHTIMTSGAILILVTGILGIFSAAKVTSQVCLTISAGSLIAVCLIVFVLPGMLDFFDRFVAKKK